MAKRPSISRISKKPRTRVRSSAAEIGEQLVAAREAAQPAPKAVETQLLVFSSQVESLCTVLLARLSGIEESLARLVSHVEQAPVKAPRKPKAAPVEAPGSEDEGAPKLVVDDTWTCCNARVASGIHKSDCPVAYPLKPVPVSYDELRAAAVAFASAKSKDELVARIQKYAPTGKLTEVAEASRAALLAELK